MITVNNVSLAYGKRTLFKEVNLKFTPGNCYGLIGANGAGKSTFVKILSGEIESDTGEVQIPGNARLAVLKQDQFAYDEYTVLQTVILGYEKLWKVMQEREALYAKENMTDDEGLRVAELEGEFAEMGGWEAESEAGTLLSGLGIGEKYHQKFMKDLEGGEKVRVLLAQALFGNPDILLLDEPTNHLDLESIHWLQDFLEKFPNTVIVVSHDRHFLNQVCTHIADIDFGAITLYVGNYDFWYQMSQLLNRQKKEEKRRSEEKAAELKAFIQRFASNASKARQATSRQKLLDKLDLDSLKPSSRKFPYIGFKAERDCGRVIASAKGISKTIDGLPVLKNFDLTIEPGDKIAFLGDAQKKSVLFEILGGEMEPDAGVVEWGQTITKAYIPKDSSRYFQTELNLVDWLGQYSKEKDETYLRGFLGRMLFSGDEALKPVNVLSGGEKVRCMMSRLMLAGANVLILDEPTNHLDLEAITTLNTAMTDFDQVLMFTSHDHELNSTVANRIIEFTPVGVIDRRMGFEDYLASPDIRKLRDEQYHGHVRLVLED
ncbi:MAG: ATP-binding cassette domain-containing protein [Spirochaetales bacterium]|nr:ATP-binding cassette domain-containing protein [Spirochaetales bacterium]